MKTLKGFCHKKLVAALVWACNMQYKLMKATYGRLLLDHATLLPCMHLKQLLSFPTCSTKKALQNHLQQGCQSLLRRLYKTHTPHLHDRPQINMSCHLMCNTRGQTGVHCPLCMTADFCFKLQSKLCEILDCNNTAQPLGHAPQQELAHDAGDTASIKMLPLA